MPNETQIEWWLKTGVVYGLGFILLAGIVVLILYAAWLLIRGTRYWLPRLLSGHMDFIENTKITNACIADNSERTTKAVEVLTESYGVSSGNHGKTHRALEHLANAAKSHTTCDDVHEHIDKAIEELRKP